MYKSPIEIIYGQLQMQFEGEVLRAVQSYDIKVDKEELLRALQYDRGQYEKGYQDGCANGAQKWIPVAERLPEEGKSVLAYRAEYSGPYGDIVVAEYQHGYWYGCKGLEMTHWMPLPEPPTTAT